MFKLSMKSKSKLEGIHPDLAKVVNRAIEITTIDFTVIEGLRTKETQLAYVKKGVSKTMNSKHLAQKDGFSHAVDLAPYVSGKIPWEDHNSFKLISEAMKTAAKELEVNITWGGDWKSFYDAPHYQINI